MNHAKAIEIAETSLKEPNLTRAERAAHGKILKKAQQAQMIAQALGRFGR